MASIMNMSANDSFQPPVGYYENLKIKERAQLVDCTDEEVTRRIATFDCFSFSMRMKPETAKGVLKDIYDGARFISEGYYYRFDVNVPDFQVGDCFKCKMNPASYALKPCFGLICFECASKSLQACVIHDHPTELLIALNKPFIGQWVPKRCVKGQKKSLNKPNAQASTSTQESKAQAYRGVFSMDDFPGLKERIYSTSAAELLEFLSGLKIQDIRLDAAQEELATKACEVFLSNMDTNFSIKQILNPSGRSMCEDCVASPAGVLTDECRHLICPGCIQTDEENRSLCPVCETQMFAPQRWAFDAAI